jgi:TonB family protein
MYRSALRIIAFAAIFLLGALHCAHKPSPPAVAPVDPAALQAVAAAREIVISHASEVQECFRIAQGYGPVTVSKTRSFEAISSETISLPSPRTDDPVPVYALIKCIRERAGTWGLPTRPEHKGFNLFFFLGPTVPPGDVGDSRLARSIVLVKTDTTILCFDAGLLRPPRKLSGPDPEYTFAASSRGITGEMQIKCTITARGDVHDCHVLQGLVYLDVPAIKALEARRYLPATWNDEPLDVEYLFKITARIY